MSYYAAMAARPNARTRLRTILARLLTTIWFRSSQREGQAPTDGGVLFVLNHPNGLLDPLVATAQLQRPPRMLAKATLWKNPVLLPFLSIFDPIPVQRRQDGEVEDGATERMFAAVHQALAQGDAIAIFPEGISHGDRDLAPLKTGAARIVLCAPTPIRLVPVGLVYGERETFRHSVLLRVGPPIEFDDLRGLDPACVRALTERIRDSLYPLTLHGDDEEVSRLAETLAWLLSEGPATRARLDRVRARKRVLTEQLAKFDETTRAQIAQRAHRARELLNKHGVRPDQLAYDYSPAEIRRWLPRFAVRLLLLPFTLTVGALFWPAYRLIGLVIGRLSLDIDVVATYKFLFGLVLMPAWLGLLAFVAGWLWGIAAVLAMFVAAAAAFVALPLAERTREDLQAIRGFFRGRDEALSELVEERTRLLEAFPELASEQPQAAAQ